MENLLKRSEELQNDRKSDDERLQILKDVCEKCQELHGVLLFNFAYERLPIINDSSEVVRVRRMLDRLHMLSTAAKLLMGE